ncbi:hypothetical protein C8R46DRAFT_1139701 [Mycena filopes]|nr:hypothetical protein C8R46DRAFT_1139701 [Mycena filopes]
MEDPQLASGPFFPGSHHFTIAGGTFTSVTSPDVPSDFRMLPLGDIDLRRELRIDRIRVADDSGVVPRGLRRCVRRVYSAKVQVPQVGMTAVIYEGDNAEEEWRGDIARYMAVRHPNIMQIFGAASSGVVHATVFHDGTTSSAAGTVSPMPFLGSRSHPVQNLPGLLSRFSDSYRIYLWIYDWTVTKEYVRSRLGIIRDVHPALWIRRSTGLLCLDLVLAGPGLFPRINSTNIAGPDQESLADTNLEAIAIRRMSLEQYHTICDDFLRRYRHALVSTSTTITLEGLISWTKEDQLVNLDLPTRVPDVAIQKLGWDCSGGWLGAAMPDGSIRFNSVEISEKSQRLLFHLGPQPGVWISQASHVLHRLQIMGRLKDHVLVDTACFTLRVHSTADAPPGYLFLCPSSDFQTGPRSFRCPDTPAYWSLDPLGFDRLSTDKATRMGFPQLLLTTEIFGRSWDADVYAGVRQFHAAKGFDPDSQQVARHLGYPLYEMSSEEDAPFAHVEEPESPNPVESASGGLKILINLQLALISFSVLYEVCQAAA